MRQSNFALRLPPMLLDEARRTATNEGIALNQLISIAVAEKLAALRTERFFQARRERADIDRAAAILAKLPGRVPPRRGDSVPSSPRAAGTRARAR
jgi:hypothetical protein